MNAGGWKSFALTLVVAAVIAAGAGFVGAKLGQTHAPPRASALHRKPPAQRTGGAYCNPPLVHSRLRPRAILSGEPWPTLRSNTSP